MDRDAEQAAVLDALEEYEHRLKRLVRSEGSRTDALSVQESEAQLAVLVDVMTASALLAENNAADAAAAWWNLGGILVAAKRPADAAAAYSRAGQKFTLVLTEIRSGRVAGDLEDEACWAATAFCHACRGYLEAGLVTAAAAAYRLVDAADLAAELKPLFPLSNGPA